MWAERVLGGQRLDHWLGWGVVDDMAYWNLDSEGTGCRAGSCELEIPTFLLKWGMGEEGFP